MRIYHVTIESTRWGRNWSAINISARSFDEAVRKAKKTFEHNHFRIESIELTAVADS